MLRKRSDRDANVRFGGAPPTMGDRRPFNREDRPLIGKDAGIRVPTIDFILPAVRRIVLVCLLTLMAVLPAIDVVYCPDGCTDAGRTQSAWHGHVVGHAGSGCGVCMNGVAVSSPAPYVAPAQRTQSLAAPRARRPVRTMPRQVDQPPRRS